VKGERKRAEGRKARKSEGEKVRIRDQKSENRGLRTED